MDSLRQIVYASRPDPALTMDDVHEIVESAQTWNARNEITGRLLVIVDDEDALLSFMQWIEGPGSEIEACIRRIVCDPRHSIVRIVNDVAVDARSYPEWSMRLETLTRERVDAALAGTGLRSTARADGAVVVEGEVVLDPPAA